MRKSAVFLGLIILLSGIVVSADDAPFRFAKFLHFSCSMLDYQTTLHASRSMRFEESDIITKLYWRSPPAFCAFKTVEIMAQNWLFNQIYKWSKPVAYITVVVFAIVRIIAFKQNLRVIRG